MTAGCGSLLIPASGPNSVVIRSKATWNGPPYGLVKLTSVVVDILDEYGPHTLTATFGDRRPPPQIKFGIGDVVSVTIFEAAAGYLSMSAETSFVWTTNPMALRKFLRERCHDAADAEIFRFAKKLARICFRLWPNLFLGKDLDGVRAELAKAAA